jgi:hypothetical protein
MDAVVEGPRDASKSLVALLQAWLDGNLESRKIPQILKFQSQPKKHNSKIEI